MCRGLRYFPSFNFLFVHRERSVSAGCTGVHRPAKKLRDPRPLCKRVACNENVLIWGQGSLAEAPHLGLAGPKKMGGIETETQLRGCWEDLHVL